ncbi:microtubule-binding protein MIP-T3-domain-containing protein [Obelidium mucronatum]|nr:microtubule-binding protein MIP-T3-domain-containing protein [Obelidium mucronatum]
MPDPPAGAPTGAPPALPPALEESIKKTIDLLSRVIKKPPLNAKLLSKPPFRYLHDIFSETIRATEETGFCRGLYDDNEMNSENVKDKDAKVAYLYKMIDCIGMVTNVEIKANPLKIVAGMDPEDTNAFLQLMAKVVLKKADTTSAVKRVLAGEHFKKGVAPASQQAAPAQAKEQQQQQQQQQQPPPQPQKEKEREKERERAPSGDRLKGAASARPREPKLESQQSRENGSRQEKRSSESLQEGKDRDHRENKENRDRGDRESRDRGDRERNDRDRDDDRPPLEASSSSSDLEDSDKKATSLVPTPAAKRRERPTTARAPPPKVKGAEFAAVEEAPIAPSIIQEGARQGDSDSEDDQYVIIGTDEELRAKEEERRDSKGSEDELHGGLMRKIMETKDKHSKRDEDERRGEREEKPKEKSVAKREIEGLRESIQTLCRSTNPLAKTMDYMQEDVDSMNKELEFWRKEGKKYSLALDEASRDTYEALMPLDLKLKQIESSIEDMVDKISNQKAGIIQNEIALQRLLKIIAHPVK